MCPVKEAQHSKQHPGRKWQRPQECWVCPIIHVGFQACPGQYACIPVLDQKSSGRAVAWIGWPKKNRAIPFQLNEAGQSPGSLAVLIDQSIIIPVSFTEVGVFVDAGHSQSGSQVRQGFGVHGVTCPGSHQGNLESGAPSLTGQITDYEQRQEKPIPP
ncbi:hypothetical protein PDJAM_G00169300, partial [Pangasius djambal]|nr:hypothetical protein [Pangasius djambal]